MTPQLSILVQEGSVTCSFSVPKRVIQGPNQNPVNWSASIKVIKISQWIPSWAELALITRSPVGWSYQDTVTHLCGTQPKQIDCQWMTFHLQCRSFFAGLQYPSIDNGRTSRTRTKLLCILCKNWSEFNRPMSRYLLHVCFCHIQGSNLVNWEQNVKKKTLCPVWRRGRCLKWSAIAKY